MNKEVVVYALRSTRDGAARYIGQTSRGVKRRLTEHRYFAKVRKNKLSYWILKEEREGFRIEILPLERFAVWNETEDSVIESYIALGIQLLNARVGGQGIFGWQLNSEQRAARAANRRGRSLSEEARSKISATKALNPCFWTDERRQAVSSKQKGRIFTPEHKAAISCAKRGSVVSGETRAKISAALTGKTRSPGKQVVV